MRKGLFVTGTDTGVGKTTVTAAIARRLKQSGIRVGVLKPVASGSEVGTDGLPRWEDAELLGAAVGGGLSRERVAPLVFQAPLAPPVAARQENRLLEFEEVVAATFSALDWWIRERDVELMLVEGVGGWLCPLAETATVADLAALIDFPVLAVARRGLGTLNHTLLTVDAIRRRGCRLAGVVLNGAEATTNLAAETTNGLELVRWLPDDVALITEIPFCAESGDTALMDAIDGVDWEERADRPRWSWPR